MASKRKSDSTSRRAPPHNVLDARVRSVLRGERPQCIGDPSFHLLKFLPLYKLAMFALRRSAATAFRGAHLVSARSFSGNKSFQDVVREALEENNMGARADSILNNLEEAAVTRTDIALHLNDSDWGDIGVKVGERVVLKNAFQSAGAVRTKLTRQFSRGGTVGTHHQRSL